MVVVGLGQRTPSGGEGQLMAMGRQLPTRTNTG